ncbi:hypothetical protein [Vulcanisaeta sp. JCM 14467]|uniref:hypothetical protein n=1 Tax=Vulcanisaeta sp. JCM 14467 TaxID=1295370 RepID=UPI0006D1F2C3|nr:hypothetical protein [Vulcanisaeta sp. JCM 14467]
MRYTVVLATVLFIVTIIILIYYAVFMDKGQFLIGNDTNRALDVLMLSLVILSGIITGIVYLFSSRVEKSGGNVQTVQY